MNRLRQMFELTVAERRVVIALLAALMIVVTIANRRHAADQHSTPTAASAQPSPSPGIRP